MPSLKEGQRLVVGGRVAHDHEVDVECVTLWGGGQPGLSRASEGAGCRK